jgi:hypothetical protein
LAFLIEGFVKQKKNDMEKLTPQQVREYLLKEDIDVTEEMAAGILKFMTMMANITVENYLKKHNYGEDEKHESKQDRTQGDQP